jgi:hypothetical protein
VQWFPAVSRTVPKGGVGSALAALAVGGLAGFALLEAHRPLPAYLVWGLSGSVGVIALTSASARVAIDGALAAFGRLVGTGLGVLLLSVVYILVMTPTRFIRRMLGADDLHLRDRDRVSYWLPADRDRRKVRWIGSMFATEARIARRGSSLATALIVTVLMLALAEGAARTKGFGHAVLYHADPVVGYYPSPNQDLARYGGGVRTNSFGMRSQEIAAKKAPGDFRILMLGDSTQWGGSYVDQRDIYSTRIQTMLNERGGPGRVEVLAIGANGWGPFHERGYITKFGTFDADVAVINMPLDDVNRPLYGLMDAPFFGDVKPPTFALEEFLNNLTWRYRKAHAGLNARWEAEMSPLGIAEYGRLADDLHKSIREVHGAILPGRSSGMGGTPTDSSYRWLEPMRATFTEHGVITTYPRGLFAGKGKPDEVYYDGTHLNPKGHEVYAAFLFEQLEQGDAWKSWLGRTAAPPARADAARPVP